MHSGRSRNSIQGRHFNAHVVQCRDNRLRSGPVRVRVLPWAPIHAPVAQPTERRASNAEVEGASPSGNTISSRNANRTSVPGLGANEIVPPSCGMRSMSSTFRHFMTLSSNWPRHPTFYRITAGSNPARVAIFHAHVVQQHRHDVESVASAGAAPKRDSASS